MRGKTGKSAILKLQKQMKEVEQEIANYLSQLQTQVDPDVDEADPGVATQSITVALLANARQKADSIKRAIEQARAGGYGVCESCQKTIDPERLEIFPQATLCVPCKSVSEARFSFRAA